MIICSALIAMQNDTDIWHKNFLTEEGTGVNIYEALKSVKDMFYRDRQDAITYYHNQMSRQIINERETSEVFSHFNSSY